MTYGWQSFVAMDLNFYFWVLDIFENVIKLYPLPQPQKNSHLLKYTISVTLKPICGPKLTILSMYIFFLRMPEVYKNQ